MSRMDSILEDILYDAVDSYVSENREEIITDICRVASEEGKSLPSALEAVVVDWLSEGDGYFYIRDDMECQAEQSCDYEYDCEKIIFEYGFTNSLEAAKEMGVRLSDTDESEVAAAVDMGAWPGGTQAVEHGRRTCGGCDFSDMDETAVASAVLHQNLPSVEELQEEIVSQIQECSSYLERVAEYENSNLESVDEEDAEDEEGVMPDDKET